MNEFEPPIDVVIFSINKHGEPRLYHGVIPAQVRWDILHCPPGSHLTIPTRIKELPDHEKVPIYNIAERLTPRRWDAFRSMN